jgi:hypothetical protein
VNIKVKIQVQMGGDIVKMQEVGILDLGPISKTTSHVVTKSMLTHVNKD